MEMTEIRSFAITGLFGQRDIHLYIKDGILITVGENGTGKTTVLAAFYYFISCMFDELCKIEFATVSIKFDDRVFSFSRDEILHYVMQMKSSIHHSPFYARLNNNLNEEQISELRNIIHSKGNIIQKGEAINDFLKVSNINIPLSTIGLFHEVKGLVDDHEYNSVAEYVSYRNKDTNRILFLPTYRRIEKNIIKDISHKINENYPFDIEDENDLLNEIKKLVHFGMADIESKVKEILLKISAISRRRLNEMSTSLLKEGIDGFTHNYELQEEDFRKIDNILQHKETGLSSEEITQLRYLIKSNRIYDGTHNALLYQLNKLTGIYDSYEEYDKSISAFAETCNKYLYGKHFVYNRYDMTLDLEYNLNRDNYGIRERIELENLSSGEKQMVALFAMVYLDKKPFYLFIDEPEMSLSIIWQRTLLADIIKSDKCRLLFAATHSPYIFEDDMLFNHTIALQDYTEYYE